jgi:hypothetical protein
VGLEAFRASITLIISVVLPTPCKKKYPDIVFTKRNQKDIILQASITKWNSLTGGPVTRKHLPGPAIAQLVTW